MVSCWSVTVVVLAAALYAVWELPRPTYHVHEQGVVLVTGASSGIGRHAAIELAKLGYEVYGTVRKERDANDIRGLGIKTLHPIIMDVTNSEQIKNAVETISKLDQPLIALVNNAGISSRAPLEAYDMNRVRNTFEVNIFGLVETTQAFLPLLRANKGRIINIGSVAGLVGMEGSAVYSGTKFALEGISDSLRRELFPLGVSVSLVEPAYVKTEIVHKSSGAQSAEHWASKEMLEVYDHFFSVADEKRQRAFEHADTPECTTNAIVDAIRSPQPRTRYVVANTHKIPAWITTGMTWLLPDRAVDAIMRRQDQVTAMTEGRTN